MSISVKSEIVSDGVNPSLVVYSLTDTSGNKFYLNAGDCVPTTDLAGIAIPESVPAGADAIAAAERFRFRPKMQSGATLKGIIDKYRDILLLSPYRDTKKRRCIFFVDARTLNNIGGSWWNEEIACTAMSLIQGRGGRFKFEFSVAMIKFTKSAIELNIVDDNEINAMYPDFIVALKDITSSNTTYIFG